MGFWDELTKLKKVFFPWLFVWFGLAIILISFPSPFDSVAIFLLETAKQNLLPEGVRLVTLNPLNAFVALMLISLVLSFIASSPLFLYKLIVYLSPALYSEEKKAIFKIIIPSSLLFLTGCLFSYLILVPLTFNILYDFAIAIEAETLFHIAQFVPFVLGLTIAVGILFLLPIFMVLLSRFGIIKGRFWQEKWRYSVLFFLVFSAIITPDGTGISMIILTLPLIGLYFLGAVIATKKDNF